MVELLRLMDNWTLQADDAVQPMSSPPEREQATSIA